MVAVDAATGEVFATKTPSTPEDPSIAVLEGLRKILRIVQADRAAVAAICHGTTVATNAILEERFDDLGLVTTEGFRHILEIARQSVPQGYGNSYFWVKPERIVPLDRVREVPGRLTHRGELLREFDEDAARDVARWCKRRGLRSIGVSFIHAYANPAHEQRVGAIARDIDPKIPITLSSDVQPELGEYERTLTSAINAWVGPEVSRYLDGLQSRLHGESVRFTWNCPP